MCDVVRPRPFVSGQWRPSLISCPPSDLIPEPAQRQATGFDGRPAQLAHHLCQTTTSTCCPATLGHLQDVEQRLCTDPLNIVIPDFAADALQAQTPGVSDAACACCRNRLF